MQNILQLFTPLSFALCQRIKSIHFYVRQNITGINSMKYRYYFNNRENNDIKKKERMLKLKRRKRNVMY